MTMHLPAVEDSLAELALAQLRRQSTATQRDFATKAGPQQDCSANATDHGTK